MIAETVPPAQESGMVADIRNQVVPHGRPKASPTANGTYAFVAASAADTGSPGASHRETSNGTLAP